MYKVIPKVDIAKPISRKLSALSVVSYTLKFVVLVLR